MTGRSRPGGAGWRETDLSPATVAGYGADARRCAAWLAAVGYVGPLAAVSLPDARAYRDALVAAHRSPATINRALGSLARFLDDHGLALAPVWACVDSVDTRRLGTTVLGKKFTVAKTHAPYSPAFRAEAVELARTSGTGIPQLAQALGIAGQALRGWMKRADLDGGRGPAGELTTAARGERRRLRREVQVLQQEREIVREAAASFAQETL